MSHKDRLIAFLKKDVGGLGLSNSQIKEFSSMLKNLEIIDMSSSRNAEWLISDTKGQAVLVSLGTYYSLGMLSKISEIKDLCMENKV